MTSTTASPNKRNWGMAYPFAISLLAAIVSGVAIGFALHADVVQVLPGEDQTSTALVEELQRANDRLLGALWSTLGIAVTLVLLVVGLNLFRGDRVIEREREVVERGFGLRLTESETLTRAALGDRVDSEVRRLEQKHDQEIQSITEALSEERRERAVLTYRILEIQQSFFLIRLNTYPLLNNGESMPGIEMRLGSWGIHAHEFLSSAINSGRPELIRQVLGTLDRWIGEQPNPQSGIFFEAIRQRLRSLPNDYDPLRSDLLERLGPTNPWEVQSEAKS